MTNIDDEIKEMTDAHAAYQKLMDEKGESLIKRIVTRMFEITGDKVETIAWTQYAPGFNDGDPCIFNVHDRGFYGPDEEVSSYQDEYGCSDEYRETPLNLTPDQIEQIEKLDKQLWAIDKNVFERTFGNDCRVCATLVNGEVQFETEWVDHD